MIEMVFTALGHGDRGGKHGDRKGRHYYTCGSTPGLVRDIVVATLVVAMFPFATSTAGRGGASSRGRGDPGVRHVSLCNGPGRPTARLEYPGQYCHNRRDITARLSPRVQASCPRESYKSNGLITRRLELADLGIDIFYRSWYKMNDVHSHGER